MTDLRGTVSISRAADRFGFGSLPADVSAKYGIIQYNDQAIPFVHDGDGDARPLAQGIGKPFQEGMT